MLLEEAELNSAWNEKSLKLDALHVLRPAVPAFACWKWLAALATIKPDVPVVMSFTSVSRPFAVSLSATVITSLGFIRNVFVSGVNDAGVWVIGPGGPGGIPFVSISAKLTGSVQPGLQWPTVSHSRLSMFSAAHHFVPEQLTGFSTWPALVNPGG